jgi:hypothetical protein
MNLKHTNLDKCHAFNQYAWLLTFKTHCSQSFELVYKADWQIGETN